MRRACLPLLVFLAAGCRGGPEGQIAGAWKVDPASVQFNRLGVGADQKQDWIDAKNTLGTIGLTFTRNPNKVVATGLGMASEGGWKVSGDAIEITAKEAWPKLTYDSKKNVIHMRLDRGSETLAMDLTK